MTAIFFLFGGFALFTSYKVYSDLPTVVKTELFQATDFFWHAKEMTVRDLLEIPVLWWQVVL